MRPLFRSGFIAGGAVAADGDSALLVTYADEVDPERATYRVTAAPLGLAFADGPLIVPQSGPVTG